MKDEEGTTTPAHSPGTRKGEEIKEDDGKESGRDDTGSTGAGRPAGKRDARDSTRVNPKDPIDPDSPDMPPA